MAERIVASKPCGKCFHTKIFNWRPSMIFKLNIASTTYSTSHSCVTPNFSNYCYSKNGQQSFHFPWCDFQLPYKALSLSHLQSKVQLPPETLTYGLLGPLQATFPSSSTDYLICLSSYTLPNDGMWPLNSKPGCWCTRM